jgi:molecular chaperone GrpE (heat shock protein)
VGNSLVKRIDFVELMLKHAEKKDDSELEKQLEILRNEFLDLLDDCAIEPFTFPAGAVIDTKVRNRIQVVKGERSVVRRNRPARLPLPSRRRPDHDRPKG